MKKSLPYIVLLGGVSLWCFGLLIPSLIAAYETPSTQLSQYGYRCFSTICHQYDSRSLHIFGYKLAVCARCTAIYFGFLIGTLAFPLVRKRITSLPSWLLGIAVLPMVIDVVSEFMLFHQSMVSIRIITGAIFGIVAALVLVPICLEAVKELFSRKHQSKGVSYESQTR
jgi:uncharacterized membrane protein